jgi:hypothetical protein
VVDQYLKQVIWQPVDKKRGASSFYLTEEQYGEVMYLTTIYPRFLILQISVQTMEYMCAGMGVMGEISIQTMEYICESTGLALNSLKCQRSEGRTKVVSLNTPTMPMDISAKLCAW